MAKLQFKTTDCEPRIVELKLGVNRLGRCPGSDLQLEHQSVSGIHCEVTLGCGKITLRDCGSTNGTFLDEVPVREATLHSGQKLRLGEVELLVVDTEVPVTIPQFEVVTTPPAPITLANGSVLCRQHPSHLATYRCQHCQEIWCIQCIHRLRRRGGKLLSLCPGCSYPVELIGGEVKKKKSLFRRLRETTKLLFSRGPERN
jgi:FHA domain-containing protein